MKSNSKGWFFWEKNLLLNSDVVFDYESNGRNYIFVASPSGKKKNSKIFEAFIWAENPENTSRPTRDVILRKKLE